MLIALLSWMKTGRCSWVNTLRKFPSILIPFKAQRDQHQLLCSLLCYTRPSKSCESIQWHALHSSMMDSNSNKHIQMEDYSKKKKKSIDSNIFLRSVWNLPPPWRIFLFFELTLNLSSVMQMCNQTNSNELLLFIRITR